MLTGWKTLIFSAAVALLGVLQATNWTDLLGSTTGGYIVMGIGVAGAILRIFTSPPVTKSS